MIDFLANFLSLSLFLSNSQCHIETLHLFFPTSSSSSSSSAAIAISLSFLLSFSHCQSTSTRNKNIINHFACRLWEWAEKGGYYKEKYYAKECKNESE
jgi:hypothetical protein